MTKRLKNLLINLLFPIIGIILFLIIWSVGFALYKKPFILPSPLSTIKKAGELLISANFYHKFLYTLIRALIAFSISYLVALLCAVLFARNDLKKIVAPIMTLMRSLPTVAVVTIIILWTSTSITPVVVAVMLILPTLYSSFCAGMLKIEKELIEVSRVFGANSLSIAKNVYIPSLRELLIENAASGISMTLKMVVSAELVAGTVKSIGRVITDFDVMFDTAGVMASAALTAFFCIIAEYLIRIPLNKRY